MVRFFFFCWVYINQFNFSCSMRFPQGYVTQLNSLYKIVLIAANNNLWEVTCVSQRKISYGPNTVRSKTGIRQGCLVHVFVFHYLEWDYISHQNYCTKYATGPWGKDHYISPLKFYFVLFFCVFLRNVYSIGSPTVGTTSSSVRLPICAVTYMTEISLNVT